MGFNDKNFKISLTPEGSNFCQISVTKVQRSIFNLRFSPSILHTYIYTAIRFWGIDFEITVKSVKTTKFMPLK